MTHEPTEPETSAPGRPTRRPEGARRGLAPREHGAYGQLGLPVVTAIAMGRPTLASICLATGAIAAFFAHEPVLVLTGQRGTRAQREDGGRARQRVALLGALTAAAGGAGLWLSPPAARAAAAAPVLLALALAPLVARGQEKTATGELLAAATLAGAGVPVAIAAGVTSAAAWGAWAAWCLSFAASTLAVRSVIAHARNPMSLPRRVIGPVGTLVALALFARHGQLPIHAALGALPMVLVALFIAVRPPGPRSLKKVGWSLVGASVVLSLALGIGNHL